MLEFIKTHKTGIIAVTVAAVAAITIILTGAKIYKHKNANPTNTSSVSSDPINDFILISNNSASDNVSNSPVSDNVSDGSASGSVSDGSASDSVSDGSASDSVSNGSASDNISNDLIKAQSQEKIEEQQRIVDKAANAVLKATRNCKKCSSKKNHNAVITAKNVYNREKNVLKRLMDCNTK